MERKPLKAQIESEYKRERIQPYQDDSVDGVIMEYGRASSKEKIDIIMPYLPDCHFSFLDLGANLGHISRAISEKMNCYGIMVEAGPSLSRCELLLHLNNSKGLILCGKKVESYEDILKVIMVFDVVLALDWLHWFSDPFAMLDAICLSGRQIFISLPPVSDDLAIGADLMNDIYEYMYSKYEVQVIGTYPRTHASGIGQVMMIKTKVVSCFAIEDAAARLGEVKRC